jgi:hypothetical protein
VKILKYSVVAVGMLLTTPVFADDPAPANNPGTVTIDLTKLDQTSRNAILDELASERAKTAMPAITVDKAKEWAITGKGIGDAIAASAKAMSVGVNDFIKTPAGTLTVVTIFLYLFGHAFWAAVGGSIVWIVLGCVIWRSFMKFHGQKIIADKDGRMTTIEYDWHSHDAKVWSAIAHAAVFIFVSVSMTAIIFSA